MYPWTHAIFGYAALLAVAGVLRRRLSRATLLAVIAGTQVPDIVDKPLAWWFSVLPSGRSLGHSLLFAVPLVLLVLGITHRRDHVAVGLSFALGYASHLAGDTYVAILTWRVDEFTFLLWPILPAYPYDEYVGFLDFFGRVEPSIGFFAFLGIGIAVGAVFLVHFARLPWWQP